MIPCHFCKKPQFYEELGYQHPFWWDKKPCCWECWNKKSFKRFWAEHVKEAYAKSGETPPPRYHRIIGEVE